MACRLGCNNPAAWYQHPVYAPYWKHYELMLQWMEQRQYHEMKEREVVDREMQYKSCGCCRCCRNTALTPASSSFINSSRRNRNAPRNFESSKSRRTKKQSGSRFHYENNVHRNSKDRNRPSVPKRVEDHGDPEDVSENSEKEPEEDSDLEYEFLITDEFISFMKQSEAFRRERDAEKKKRNEDVDVEYIDLSSVTVDGLPKIGQPNVGAAAEAKRQLMEQWYGKKNAPVITGMETAMRCSFNWLKVHQQPVMWPNIPIKIKFD